MLLLVASRSARLLEARLHSRVARLAGNFDYTAGAAIFQVSGQRLRTGGGGAVSQGGRPRPRRGGRGGSAPPPDICAEAVRTRTSSRRVRVRLRSVGYWSCAAPHGRAAISAHAGLRGIDWERLPDFP